MTTCTRRPWISRPARDVAPPKTSRFKAIAIAGLRYTCFGGLPRNRSMCDLATKILLDSGLSFLGIHWPLALEYPNGPVFLLVFPRSEEHTSELQSLRH